ncbi:Transcription initiation factor TFIID subunit 12 [Mycena kentingensis (nom. inval.)]|nr:Transcription initiation factor TFIID subunit 12 [Mycena kentingensis (nom. inval.)]
MDNHQKQQQLAEILAHLANGDKDREAAIKAKIQTLLSSGKSLETIMQGLVQMNAQAKPASVPIPVTEEQAGHRMMDESPFLHSSSADASAYPISNTLSVSNTPAAGWPTSRPTLTGGHAMGRIAGTPSQYAREEPLPITFTADHRTATQQPRKTTPGDMSMRRTIHDLVASVDPNVKIEPEVEDLLLNIADEFIDSVTNFACRLAKHRGGETLEVRDLQLHLERNHNIRIPGFSADDTRISLSQSSITPAAAPAPAPKKTGTGTHMTLRSQRLAQVQQAKRESKLM